jgi:transposase
MAKYKTFASSLINLVGQANEEKKSLQLRALVHHLYFKEQVSKKMIVRQLQVSKGYVQRWTSAPEQDLTADARGWPKDRRRHWDQTTIERIKEIHQFQQNDPRQFFCGATAITQEWRRRYPQAAAPPLRTIGRVLAELGLSGKRRTTKAKGAARYLCYPEHTIYQQLPGRVLEADFIGKKYLGGGEPLNFIGFSFKKEPKLRHFQYVPAQTADVIISQAERFFARFEKPDYFKVDNCGATIGSGSGQRTLSRFICFLLSEQIIPIFAVPRKPFSQASIEGNNSVFSRKFWNQREFTGQPDVVQQLEWFNEASELYTGYRRPSLPRASKTPFVPQVYFIRQVADEPGARSGFINVLNEKISLPAAFINYFVLARWDLSRERLDIYFEKELKAKRIKQMKFAINQKATYKKGSFSFGH